MLAIDCRQLVKTYPARPPVEAVRGLDLQVQQGECFGLLGPNGAGKTTTIEILEGLLRPTSGAVQLLGRRWGGRNDLAIKQRIGISLQETRLPDKLSVMEILTLFRSFYRDGIEPEEVMRRVSLQDKARSWVVKLSGGQRQRLAVACALVGDPELLFLDEPTTGLDPTARRQLWDVIRSFRNQGRAVLLTTHYMDEAQRLCDRVAIVDQGRVIALGTPTKLIATLGGQEVIELELTGSAIQDDSPIVHGLSGLPGVHGVQREQARYALAVSDAHLVLPRLLEWLSGQGLVLGSLGTRHASLEDVFIQHAGRRLTEPADDA